MESKEELLARRVRIETRIEMLKADWEEVQYKLNNGHYENAKTTGQ